LIYICAILTSKKTAEVSAGEKLVWQLSLKTMVEDLVMFCIGIDLDKNLSKKFLKDGLMF